ncbi:MAG: diacylglycerol kinase [Steroidobacteraceae bacterium]|nr:diacylglycerol kinase [Steroidobacteraceae bacterium]MDW8259899.1 diacylglycerol kinase [Gammaproteobacteria bacterium]
MNDSIDRAKPTGATRLWRAFGNTARGLRAAYRDEAAFRQELALAALVLPAGLWLGDGAIEKLLLTLPMLLILAIELLNSAIEAAIDRIGFERHPLSGLAKDLGSAAVFIGFVMLGLSWGLIVFD